MRGRLVRDVLESEIPGHLLDGSLDGRVGVYELLYSGLGFLLPELFRPFLQLGAVVQKPVLELPERSAEKIPWRYPRSGLGPAGLGFARLRSFLLLSGDGACHAGFPFLTAPSPVWASDGSKARRTSSQT